MYLHGDTGDYVTLRWRLSDRQMAKHDMLEYLEDYEGAYGKVANRYEQYETQLRLVSERLKERRERNVSEHKRKELSNAVWKALLHFTGFTRWQRDIERQLIGATMGRVPRVDAIVEFLAQPDPGLNDALGAVLKDVAGKDGKFLKQMPQQPALHASTRQGEKID